ncbi:hypothetical protein MYX84_12555 [Acidobacteria bacterium AH-259-O06]|nr:hypothetical protein [Acidobacteria bacterium AH-259-O06]
MKRDALPIKVSDQVWNLIEEIQVIEPLQLKIDLTRRNGKVSPNVAAQFRFHSSTFEIRILLYEQNLSEEILAHEVLHAWKLVVGGHPRFYRNRFFETKTIDNLEGPIQHQHIFQVLEKMGFDPIPGAKEDWERGIKILLKESEKIPLDRSQRELTVMGATYALGGLVAGLDSEQVRQAIPPRLRQGVDKAVEIHKELSKADLTTMQENFRIRRRIASILDLTISDAVIRRFDFKVRSSYAYDPVSGQQVE